MVSSGQHNHDLEDRRLDSRQPEGDEQSMNGLHLICYMGTIARPLQQFRD